MLAAMPAAGVRLGTVLCAAAAVVMALAYFPDALDRFGDRADFNSHLSYADREVAGGNAVVVDQAALYAARAWIPEDGTYRVLLGPGLKKQTPLTRPHVETLFHYFLMPRRPSPAARWVVCYGCDISRLSGRLRVVWRDDYGISLVRRRR